MLEYKVEYKQAKSICSFCTVHGYKVKKKEKEKKKKNSKMKSFRFLFVCLFVCLFVRLFCFCAIAEMHLIKSHFSNTCGVYRVPDLTGQSP